MKVICVKSTETQTLSQGFAVHVRYVRIYFILKRRSEIILILLLLKHKAVAFSSQLKGI